MEQQNVEGRHPVKCLGYLEVAVLNFVMVNSMSSNLRFEGSGA